MDELYRFVAEDIGRLDGVSQVQVATVDRILKRAGTIVG